MKITNFVMMGKGGVGKTFIAWLLAQYYQRNGVPLYCADTDPVNASFTAFAAFKTQHINILDSNMNLDERNFDRLVSTLLSQEGASLVDTGASTFVPLMSYAKESGFFDMLKAEGHEIVVHVPLVGGAAVEESFRGLIAILKEPQVKVVVWENEFWGEVEDKGKKFADTNLRKQYSDRLIGVVKLEQLNPKTFVRDLAEVTKAKLTIEEALSSPQFDVMPRSRLFRVREGVFAQLDALEFYQSPQAAAA